MSNILVKKICQSNTNQVNMKQLNQLLTQLTGFEVNHTEASFKKFLSQKNLYQVGAFLDGKLVGLASLFVIEKIESSTGMLEGVVVDKNHRRQGIGQAMMQALMKKAKELSLVHLDLTSSPTRVAANRLYQKLGFEKRETNVYRVSL